MSITLTPRLKAIVNEVNKASSAVDVGCDHAQVGIWLAQNKIVDNMTVSDINEGPIFRARQAVERAGMSDKITCVKTDGLDGIAPQDCVIIAGMGGELICDIISRAEWTKSDCRLILQPMTAGEVLREYLFENGYKIIRETIAAEHDKIYAILTVEPGKTEAYDDADLYLSDTSHPLAGEFLDKIVARISRMLNGKKNAENPDEAEIARLEDLIFQLKKKRGNINAKGD